MKKKIIYIALGLIAVLFAVYFYFAWEKHPDTVNVKADYSVESLSFMKEFQADNKTANEKYADKIVEVKGLVTATESADTTINIKMEDSTSGSYLIFAFQDKHLNDAKMVKPGDMVTIKGSCSGGIHSEILDMTAITFKRSALIK